MNKLNFKKELIQINVIASIEMLRNICNNILLYVLVVIGNLYTGKSIYKLIGFKLISSMMCSLHT